jgi:hypothetical protein
MMNQDELNTRLEDLIGIAEANLMVTTAQQKADHMAQQYGVSPRSIEERCCFYASMTDELIRYIANPSEYMPK